MTVVREASITRMAIAVTMFSAEKSILIGGVTG